MPPRRRNQNQNLSALYDSPYGLSLIIPDNFSGSQTSFAEQFVPGSQPAVFRTANPQANPIPETPTNRQPDDTLHSEPQFTPPTFPSFEGNFAELEASQNDQRPDPDSQMDDSPDKGFADFANLQDLIRKPLPPFQQMDQSSVPDPMDMDDPPIDTQLTVQLGILSDQSREPNGALGGNGEPEEETNDSNKTTPKTRIVDNASGKGTRKKKAVNPVKKRMPPTDISLFESSCVYCLTNIQPEHTTHQFGITLEG